jgi:hypothetical protein
MRSVVASPLRLACDGVSARRMVELAWPDLAKMSNVVCMGSGADAVVGEGGGRSVFWAA